ncbi:MAG: helix-turn-helix domain-containing protein, partial [Salinivenus sp.]
MSDPTEVAAGKRFALDMRRIREDRDVSLSSIHEQTQIAPSLLRSFEEGGLYDHSAFNEVYLRSFVRAYAAVVGMSPKDAV